MHYLGKHEPQKLRLFSHALCRVSIMTLFSEHAVNFIFFLDEKVFTVASLVNLQNDRDCTPSNVKKRDIASERCCVVGQHD